MGVPGTAKMPLDMLEALRRSDVALAQPGVDDPDVFDAHHLKFVNFFLKVHQRVVLRKDLDADERGKTNNFVARVRAAENADVGNAEAGRARLDAAFGQRPNRPRLSICMKDRAKNRLQMSMRLFAHISFLQFTVDVVAVGLVGGLQVLAERD
jgi:hypothetical protein